MATETRDWYDWHDEYDREESHLHQRLQLVKSYLREALDQAPPGPIQLVSACAGQGRDVIEVLADAARKPDVRGRLVELDPRNAAAARSGLATIGATDVEVVIGDAGQTDVYRGAIPADIILLCGVFGNITDNDVENTISLLPGLAAPGARVIWTRGRVEPDRTPAIRAWFTEHGFTELRYAVAGERAGVGFHRLTREPQPLVGDTRLFEFVGAHILRSR